MRVLVLDTIHGGTLIAKAYREAGCEVDAINVYQKGGGSDPGKGATGTYDQVVAPVHFDSSHFRTFGGEHLTHHEAVGRLIRTMRPTPFVEVTGARGKTTTATLLATLMNGPGVLHTSRGTFRYPGGDLLWKMSVTPASVLPAAQEASRIGGWLIAEESLGVTGAGDLGILTDSGDYCVAGGTQSALAAKIRALSSMRTVITAPGAADAIPGAVAVEEMIFSDGLSCSYTFSGSEVTLACPLLAVPHYKTPVMLAVAAACTLGVDPASISRAQPVEGRMTVSKVGEITVIDTANSGTNQEVATDAASYARGLVGKGMLTLVIGMEGHAVCEGFPPEEVTRAVTSAKPDRVVLVPPTPDAYSTVESMLDGLGIPCITTGSLHDGREAALKTSGCGAVVLAVKTWR
jgi:hypothetical protein